MKTSLVSMAKYHRCTQWVAIHLDGEGRLYSVGDVCPLALPFLSTSSPKVTCFREASSMVMAAASLSNDGLSVVASTFE